MKNGTADYLENWKIEGIRNAIKEVDKGAGIDGEIISEWLESLKNISF